MRDLKKGDRVKITGPWEGNWGGEAGHYLIGDIDSVERVDKADTQGLPILLRNGWWWNRKSLRALPRRK